MNRLLVHLPEDLYEALRRRAYEEHRPMAEIVRRGLEMVLSKEPAQPDPQSGEYLELLEAPLFRQLQQRAEQEGRSFEDLLTDAVERYMRPWFRKQTKEVR